MSQNIFIVAGDFSGDMHAASLARAIKRLAPDVSLTCLGGKHLRETSDVFLFDLTSLSAFGFWQPIQQYMRLKEIFKSNVTATLENRRPDKVILVDYYGFNIHVARDAHRRGIPVYYYVSPQVWATRPGRIRKLRKYVTKMLVILPFEEAMYRKAGIDVSFVGHPLLDTVPGPVSPDRSLPALIGLFPGSRPNVFRKHLPILEEAAAIIGQRIKADFRIVSASPELYAGNTRFPVIAENDFSERRRFVFALSTSGTVSLENALMGIPMLVFYRLSWFNYGLARMLIQVPFIAMVNLLAEKEVVPELIQNRATPETIAETALSILRDQALYDSIKQELLSARDRLGTPGASERAARIILEN